MNHKRFLPHAILLLCGTVGVASAGNLQEIEPNDLPSDDNTFVLNNEDFGFGMVDGGDTTDFWAHHGRERAGAAQPIVAPGDFIYVATSSAGDTKLAVIDNDGTTIVTNPGDIDKAEDGEDDNSGAGDASAIAGLEANNPGKLYFRVEPAAGAAEYSICGIVAKPNQVALENETIAGTNDHTAIATKYSKRVMFGILEEKDTYSFKAKAGSHVMVIADNDPNGNGNVVSEIRILKSDATPIASSGISGADANATNSVEITQTGTYFVEFTNEGGDSDDYSFVICGAVLGGDDDDDEDIRRGTIGDRVWFDRNRDGVQDADEPGSAKQTVELLADDMFTVLAQTKTRKDGTYLFRGLQNGSYFVRLVKPQGALISPQNMGGDDALDSDALDVPGDPNEGVTDVATVSNGVGTVDSDIGVNADLDGVPDCAAAPPGAGNDTAQKVVYKHRGVKKLGFKGKDASIAASEITNPKYVKVCVYYDGTLIAEHYAGVGDPGFQIKPGKLTYKGKSNVTGLQKLQINSGAGTAKYTVKVKGLGESPPFGVGTVVIYVETDQLMLREAFTGGQVQQRGDSVKGKK